TEENIRKEITCQSNGEWSSPFPKCVEATCPLQWNTTEDLKIERLPDIEGLILKEQREITCQSNGEWRSPFPKCDAICVAKLTENMRSDEHPGSEVSIRPGHTITLSCVGSGSTLLGQSKITRQSNGEWSNPFPKCEAPGHHPHINDADTKEMTKDECNTGDRVECSCFNKYTLDLHREWRGNIKCLKPCTVTVEEIDKSGIELAYADQEKMFAPHNDHITFMCQRGKVSVGFALRQQCNDGVMTLPECVRQWE
uniref:Beta-2-glycoprotein 1 n=1 Tax=Sinocyclocheilus rhinocerous TaxID=307959 RepID=A0A673JJS4_9TELE